MLCGDAQPRVVVTERQNPKHRSDWTDVTETMVLLSHLLSKLQDHT